MVVTTGFFDGVHIGHRFVIQQLVKAAEERREESLVVTFWPHPRTVLQDGAMDLRLLSSLDEKKAMLYSLGVSRVEVVEFTKAFSRLTVEEYLKEYVIGRFGGKAILMGYDNRIGSDFSGPEMVAETAARLSLDVIKIDMATSMAGKTVSSTKIRSLLADGDVKAASRMLGYDYSLHGVVVSGNRLGRTIGFPTANMQLYEPLKLIPRTGSYFVKVKTLGREFKGMCNIGYRPTVTDARAMTIETNIFGFNEDIYGLDIDISFIDRIRDETKFSSIDALKSQLSSDKAYCLSL